jgi:MFS family permease
MLADRIGRKPTAVMAYLGVMISFGFTPLLFGVFQDTLRRNPYILMAGSLWILLGGGVPVLLNTLYAIAADVSSEQQKYVQQDQVLNRLLTRTTERRAFCISRLELRLVD